MAVNMNGMADDVDRRIGARSFARDLTDFMLLFSSYPGSIYSGATKLIAYSLLPAGFIVLVQDQDVRIVNGPADGNVNRLSDSGGGNRVPQLNHG